MTEDIRCEGVRGYFSPHTIPREDAFIRDGQHYCVPCFYLKLVLKGDPEQAQKALDGEIPKIPMAIDDFVLPYTGQ